MGASTCQAQCGTGASVSWANAETGGVMNREDSLAGTTPTPIPTTTGTNYSFIKNFVLAVTVTGTTNITNRRINIATGTATGMLLHWKAVAVASYAQAASGNMPGASGSNGSTPAGYTMLTTSAAQYDNASHATSSTGPSGSMVVIVEGVDNTYASGASSSATTPSLVISYDES
jgi:hypothetical protein